LLAVQLDLRNAQQIASAVRQAIARFARIDVLVVMPVTV
jgi:NADP-dependent 3-hydroxy acid dehydrogenase YdfG